MQYSEGDIIQFKEEKVNKETAVCRYALAGRLYTLTKDDARGLNINNEYYSPVLHPYNNTYCINVYPEDFYIIRSAITDDGIPRQCIPKDLSTNKNSDG